MIDDIMIDSGGTKVLIKRSRVHGYSADQLGNLLLASRPSEQSPQSFAERATARCHAGGRDCGYCDGEPGPKFSPFSSRHRAAG